MISRQHRVLTRITGQTARRFLATEKAKLPHETAQLSEEEKKKAAAALAMQSIKDIGRLLSSSPDSDYDTQPIDTKPIFEDPKLFPTLSLLHQGQVLKELQEKYDKKWTKLTVEDKQLGYYIAYGNWGSREKFDNWKSISDPPLDLPFHTPSKPRESSPVATTKINKLSPPVVLSETPIRKPQFNIKRMDGATKFFVYLIVLVAMLALYRDQHIGEEGLPVEPIIVDPYEEKRLEEEYRKKQEEERLRLEEEKRKQRKWYFLWIK